MKRTGVSDPPPPRRGVSAETRARCPRKRGRGVSAETPRRRDAPGMGSRALDLYVLDAGELAEDPPGGRVVPEVHHLVVRAARGQPAVEAGAHPGGGVELAVRHLQGRQFLAVEVLAFGDDQAEPLAFQ